MASPSTLILMYKHICQILGTTLNPLFHVKVACNGSLPSRVYISMAARPYTDFAKKKNVYKASVNILITIMIMDNRGFVNSFDNIIHLVSHSQCCLMLKKCIGYRLHSYFSAFRVSSMLCGINLLHTQ